MIDIKIKDTIKIYIAEDDPTLAGLLRVVLGMKKNYEVVFFTDGLDLYNQTLEAPPDLLILDILIPSVSGLAIARLLKFEDHYRHIPVLVITSITDPDIKERSKYAGADAFLAKPFNPELLLEMVEELVRIQQIKIN